MIAEEGYTAVRCKSQKSCLQFVQYAEDVSHIVSNNSLKLKSTIKFLTSDGVQNLLRISSLFGNFPKLFFNKKLGSKQIGSV